MKYKQFRLRLIPKQSLICFEDEPPAKPAEPTAAETELANLKTQNASLIGERDTALVLQLDSKRN